MVFRNIGFLGCGNMGGALAGACAKRTKQILLANRTPAKVEALAAELNILVLVIADRERYLRLPFFCA